MSPSQNEACSDLLKVTNFFMDYSFFKRTAKQKYWVKFQEEKNKFSRSPDVRLFRKFKMMEECHPFHLFFFVPGIVKAIIKCHG